MTITRSFLTVFLTLLFVHVTFAQEKFIQVPSRYEQEWKQFIEYGKNGIPDRQLEILDKVIAESLREKDAPEFYRALKSYPLVISQSMKEMEEKYAVLAKFEVMSHKLEAPFSNILHAFLAEQLEMREYIWDIQYYLNDFTIPFTIDGKTVYFSSNREDRKIILEHLLHKSMENLDLLVQQPSVRYVNSMRLHIQDSAALQLKPTLADFLADSYLNHFSVIDQSSETFDPKWFEPSESFVTPTAGETLKMYQQMELKHWKNGNMYAYTAYVLARLTFVYNKAVKFEKRNEKYDEALSLLTKRINGHPATLQIVCTDVRKKLSDSKNVYHWKNNPSAKDKRAEFHAVLSNALKQFPSSIYAAEARSMIESIESKVMSLYFEKPNVVGRGNLITVTYQNIDHAYLTIYHIDGYRKSEAWEDNPLNTYQLSKVYGMDLPLDMNGKFNTHSKDFIVPDLEKSGDYLFLVTPTADSASIILQMKEFENKNAAFAKVSVHTFSVIRKVQPDRMDIIVQDLKSGKPLSGAKVYMVNDNGVSRVYAGQTDKNGELKYTGPAFRTARIIYGNDSILQYVYDYYQSTVEAQGATYKMITDRRIYRPGQTVHFKIFSYNGKSPEFKPVAEQQIELTMSDYDGTEEVVATGKTNEFGTFAGTFVLPATGLPGERFFYVNQDQNIASISVEEYKRPSFEVEAKFDKTTYKLGDKVTVSGKAKAYSGYGIANAKVAVNITSSPGYRYYFGGEQETVLDTVIQANANGEFSISFIAKAKSGRFGAEFSYNISATSTSGETQTASDAVFIGQFPSEWEVHFPSEVVSTDKVYGTAKVIPDDDPKAPKQIELELWKQNPDFIAYDLTFEQHEFQGFNASELNKKVGNAGYFPSRNAVSEYIKVSTKTIQSGDSILISQLVNNTPGKYEVRLTYRNGADTIKFAQTFTYIRMDTKKGQHEADLWTAVSDKKYKPGDELKLIVGSKHKKLRALLEIHRGEQLLRHEWITIKGRKEIKYTVQKEDLGGLQVSVVAVKNYTFFERTAGIAVPFESKELKVKLETVRDILRPGSQEKWVVSVETKDGSPLSAELAVGMTDVSLDQFVSNTWDVQFYEGNYYSPQWQKNWDQPVYFSVYGEWDGRHSSFYGDYIFNGGLDEVMTLDKNTGGFPRKDATVGFISPVFSTYANTTTTAESIAYKPAETKNTAATNDKARTNFSETAFFYPQLTAKDNRFNFEFTLPDALTQWRLQALASDKLMRLGYTSNEFVAQKELMADPNEPRFFRAGDEFVFAVNVANLTEKTQNVTASLEWFDPYTNLVIPNVLGNMPYQKLSITAKGSQTVNWTLRIPKTGLDIIAYRVKVFSNEFSDIEEKVIPVLSNRTQVIESVPVTVEGKGDYVFELPKLLNPSSPTQRNEKLVLEYNANPIWSAIMAIPYIAEYPYDCAEQLFSKFFANRISQSIIAENPVIEKVLSQPATNDPGKFLSALQKNEDLKAIVLAETPWVLEAKSEAEQKRRIAQLFELNNLAKQEMQNLTKLQQMQNADGGWSWFAGGNSNIYITQHILSGFGHLRTLGLEIPEMIDLQRVMNYLDGYYAAQYKKLSKDQLKNKKGISTLEVQWLYARKMLNADTTAASEYYTACLKNDWLQFSLHIQAMAGVYFLHNGDEDIAQKIFTSIKSKATIRKNLGMYWNENKTSWYWDRNAIETQASLIEFFKKVGADEKTLASMKLWLLNQKRGQYWESTKTTAWACYALLIDAKPVTKISTDTKVFLGNQPVVLPDAGYVRQTFSGTEIQPSMGRLTVNQAKEEPAFGSLNLVYTEEIEKVTKNAAGMQLQKTVYLVKDGKEIPVTPATKLELGDLLRVHLQLSSDRELEFVHIKDLRASGTENVETMSGYRASGNLYFYNVNRDASTEFFLDRLPKGKHSLTYDMRVSGKGIQSTGYAISECLYAPEFRANTPSGSIRVE